MTRIEYDLLRDERPELSLPTFERLRGEAPERLLRLTREQLIAHRTYLILTRENTSEFTEEDRETALSFIKNNPL